MADEYDLKMSQLTKDTLGYISKINNLRKAGKIKKEHAEEKILSVIEGYELRADIEIKKAKESSKEV